MELFDDPDCPAPPGGVCETVVTPDGIGLRCAVWHPGPDARGTVCLFHGRSEFIEKYYEVIQDLLARGFVVATLDWRGQGGSSRRIADARLGHVLSFSEYRLDLQAFMRRLVFARCPPPFHALAHSMGAAILLDALADDPGWFDRFVAVAPMTGIAGRPCGARLLAETLGALGLARRVTPGWRPDPVVFRPFDGNPVSHDPVRYGRAAALVRAHPGLGLGGPTIGWVRAAFRLEIRLQNLAMAAGWRTPTLMVLAGDERIVSNPTSEVLARRLRLTRAITIPGALHEILQERDAVRDQFWAAFDAFVPGEGADAESA